MASGMAARICFLLCAACALALAQDGEESTVEIAGEGNPATSLESDPIEEPPEEADPARPAPVVVGEWEPPALDEGAAKRLAELVARRDADPRDVAAGYELSDFYVAHGWMPHAEAELRRVAGVDPSSTRPWETLIRLYRNQPPEDGPFESVTIIGPGGVRVENGRRSDGGWLPGNLDRMRRLAAAYRGLLDRRPDDIVRRRELVRVLYDMRDFPGIVEQANLALQRLPEDAAMRYELAEALRKCRREGEAIAALEENLRRCPDHAASALRLARLLAIRDGAKAAARIEDLERRGFFHLFLMPQLAPAPYRADTLQLATSLCGPALASRLWDAAMLPPELRDRSWDEEVRYTQRWIFLTFPVSSHRERLAALARMQRRFDESTVGVLVALLWHAGAGQVALEEKELAELSDAALGVLAGQGARAYGPAERFLRAATTAEQRMYGVRLLRALHDARAVGPLMEALAWDVDEERPYGVAAGLEELGDPRAIDALVAAAGDAARPVDRRREALEALAAFPDPRSIEAMRRASKEEDFALVTAYGLFRLAGDETRLGLFRARLQTGVDAAKDGGPADALRMVSKCEGPRAEELLVHAFRAGGPLQRARALEVLRARFWATARDRICEIALKEAEDPQVSEETIALLAEMPGAAVTERLLQLVETLADLRWARAARALAQTGDPRAVRYFNRARVLEKDPGRQVLAEELAGIAARRQAENEKAAAGG